MKTNSNKIYKGLVFGGCSFTWGQGLYYYSNLDTLNEPPPDAYNRSLLTDAHLKFAETLRFPRLVANHFNTFEVCMLQNGGSEDTTFCFLDKIFNQIGGQEHLSTNTFSFDEIEYVIIQTSQPNRNPIIFNIDGVEHQFRTYDPHNKDLFYKWLIEIEKISFQDCFIAHVKKYFYKLKDKMQFLESKGIKTLILNWEIEYLPYFKEDEFMMERYIPLEYNGKTYDCIRTLMNENKFLTINSDNENFSIPPTDHHPSKECHRIMADNIIKKIEGYEFDNPLIKKNEEYFDEQVENNLNIIINTSKKFI